MIRYILDRDYRPMPVNTETWLAWKSDPNNRAYIIVAQHNLPNRLRISTVFIGGMPDELWETIVFFPGDERFEGPWRYDGVAEAECGHGCRVAEFRDLHAPGY